MSENFASPQDYVNRLPEERKKPFEELRACIKDGLPTGFDEVITYGMVGFVVPHSLYPAGYHVNPQLPLPFISLANQKNYIAFYHMGLYAFPEILQWFKEEYPKHSIKKLDMGKSCIRFKNPADIPYPLIKELLQKIPLEKWLEFNNQFKK